MIGNVAQRLAALGRASRCSADALLAHMTNRQRCRPARTCHAHLSSYRPLLTPADTTPPTELQIAVRQVTHTGDFQIAFPSSAGAILGSPQPKQIMGSQERIRHFFVFPFLPPALRRCTSRPIKAHFSSSSSRLVVPFASSSHRADQRPARRSKTR